MIRFRQYEFEFVTPANAIRAMRRIITMLELVASSVPVALAKIDTARAERTAKEMVIIYLYIMYVIRF